MDWRRQLKRNQHRTHVIIGIFIIFYLGIGLLLDLYAYSGRYPTANLSDIFEALISLTLFPKFTVITGLIALISLAVTYLFYNRLILLGTDYYEVTPETARSVAEQQLYHIVEELKIAASLTFMPKVYIIEADYMNAFASGYNEKSALVAITRGLLNKLNRDQIQAVIAHELSHIRHGDIKLILMVSVLSNILLIIVDVLFYNLVFGRERRGNAQFAFIILMLRYLLPITTVLMMLYLSRTREYLADAGCVALVRDPNPLAEALIKINKDHLENAPIYRKLYTRTAHEDIRRAAYLYDPVQSGIEPVKSLANLFSTHPSLKDRLKALGYSLQA